MVASLSFLKILEALLITAVLAAVGYAGYFFVTHKNNAPSVENVVPAAIDLAKSEVVDDSKPYDYYAKQVQARDIFGFTVKAASSEGVVAALPAGQLPTNFKVVGIVMGHPVEVILEDTAIKQTYFIKQGKPQGGISIDHLEGEKIFLQYQGQKIAVAIHDNSTTNQENAFHVPFAVKP